MASPGSEETTSVAESENQTWSFICSGIAGLSPQTAVSEQQRVIRGLSLLLVQLQLLDDDAQYQSWLCTEFGEPGVLEEGVTSVNMCHLRADPSRKSGYRAVSTAGLHKCIYSLAFAQQWRLFDIAQLCRVKACAERGESKVVVAAARDKPEYVKFHHRGVALHAVVYLHYMARQEVSLPDWLLQLGKNIPCKYTRLMSGIDFVAQGTACSMLMEHGMVKNNFIDFVMAVIDSDPELGDAIQHKVQQLAPDIAANITQWKHIRALCTRVTREVYECLTVFKDQWMLQMSPVPVKWLILPFM